MVPAFPSFHDRALPELLCLSGIVHETWGSSEVAESVVASSPQSDEQSLSNMALLMTLRRLKAEAVTVHGFRASFSSWANECSIAKADAIEAALAHRETNLVRRAYNRAAFLIERRTLMVAWGQYLAGQEVIRADGTAVTNAQVLEFKAA